MGITSRIFLIFFNQTRANIYTCAATIHNKTNNNILLQHFSFFLAKHVFNAKENVGGEKYNQFSLLNVFFCIFTLTNDRNNSVAEIKQKCITYLAVLALYIKGQRDMTTSVTPVKKYHVVMHLIIMCVQSSYDTDPIPFVVHFQ